MRQVIICQFALFQHRVDKRQTGVWTIAHCNCHGESRLGVRLAVLRFFNRPVRVAHDSIKPGARAPGPRSVRTKEPAERVTACWIAPTSSRLVGTTTVLW